MAKLFAAIRNLTLVSLLSLQAHAITVHLTSLGGIEFTGGDADTFTFVNPNGGHDFKISAVTGLGSTGNIFTCMGLKGDIDGIFKIGEISKADGAETAAVTLKEGSIAGAFTIWDAQNVMLTACIQWIQIKTEAAESVDEGLQVNSAFGVLSLNNIVYEGENSELAALAAQGNQEGSASITFQFSPAQSLTALTTMDGTITTTYMGAVITTVPDGGATAALMGLGLLSVAAVARHLSQKGARTLARV